MADLSPSPKFKGFVAGTSTPLVGGKLYTYLAGTTTPQVTAKDQAGTANTNPIILDSNGECDLWLGNVSFKLVLKDSLDVTQWTVDNVQSATQILASIASSNVATFALLGSTAATLNQTVNILGHTTAGIGGGQFIAKSGSVTNDGGSKINSATAGIYWKRIDSKVTVDMFGTVRDGTTDDGPAIRLALASGYPLIFPTGTYAVGNDPASFFGGSYYEWCLKITDDKHLTFEDGSIIKRLAGAQSWNRVVIIEGSNINIYGQLYIDANVANISGTNNEHMHGVMIVNAYRTNIGAIRSVNARGDNIFIGGTDMTTKTTSLNIGSVWCKTAGRKNLVYQHCTDVNIGSATLDNSLGGSLVGGAADTTNRHCLDVEPDAFDGSQLWINTIQTLNTYGTGNDFTAGTTPTAGDNYILNIGDAYCLQSESNATVPAWIQNAITINFNTLTIKSCAGIDSSILLTYAARLRGATLKLSGACATAGGYLFLAQASGSNYTPIIDVENFYINTTTGGGASLSSVTMNVVNMTLETAATGLATRTTASVDRLSGSTTISHLKTIDCGVASTGSAVLATNSSFTNYPINIGFGECLDSRGGTKALGFISSTANSAGILLASYYSPDAVPPLSWPSTDKFYRVSGGKQNSTVAPAQFVCFGTPESMITANIGSTAVRTDGGASTTFYVKQSGTGNTGWVAK